MDYPLSLNRCLFSLFDFISGSSSWFCCSPVFSFFCFPQPLPLTGLLPSGPMSYRTFLNSTLHCPAACKNRKSKCEQQRKYFFYCTRVVPSRGTKIWKVSPIGLFPLHNPEASVQSCTYYSPSRWDEKKHGKYASRSILGCCSIFFLVISCGNHP